MLGSWVDACHDVVCVFVCCRVHIPSRTPTPTYHLHATSHSLPFPPSTPSCLTWGRIHIHTHIHIHSHIHIHTLILMQLYLFFILCELSLSPLAPPLCTVLGFPSCAVAIFPILCYFFSYLIILSCHPNTVVPIGFLLFECLRASCYSPFQLTITSAFFRHIHGLCLLARFHSSFVCVFVRYLLFSFYSLHIIISFSPSSNFLLS